MKIYIIVHYLAVGFQRFEESFASVYQLNRKGIDCRSEIESSPKG